MIKKWKAFFAGDIMIGAPPVKGLVQDDLKGLFAQHDLLSCNFEGPVLPGKAIGIPKAGSHVSQHNDAPQLISKTGFNVINLANNHIYDFGQEALDATLKAFPDNMKIGAGPDFNSAYELRTIDIKGTRVGLFAFCESEFGALIDEKTDRGGYAWINHPSVNKRINDARKRIDVLIIQVHAGAEEVELPLPEWRQRYRELVDCGADAVIGHHPHVPQGWETYNGKPIFYSLGNFYFDMERTSPNWNRGYGVSLSFDGASLSNFDVIPVERSEEGVFINESKSYRDHLDHLCDILDPEIYTKLSNEQAIWLWKNRYRMYYADSLGCISWKDSWKKVLIMAVRCILRKESKQDLLLLLHNIRIESHRWSTERALSLLLEK